MMSKLNILQLNVPAHGIGSRIPYMTSSFSNVGTKLVNLQNVKMGTARSLFLVHRNVRMEIRDRMLQARLILAVLFFPTRKEFLTTEDAESDKGEIEVVS